MRRANPRQHRNAETHATRLFSLLRRATFMASGQLAQPFQGASESFKSRRAEGGMSELAARSRGLAVNVEMSARNREDKVGSWHPADEVHHRRRTTRSGGAERQPGDRSQVIFKLAGLCPFYGPVA